MKKFLKVLPVILMVMLVFTSSVFAVGTTTTPTTTTTTQTKTTTNPIDINNLDATVNGGTTIDTVVNLAGGVWGTILVIVQILAIAAFVFAGLRYMFSSANEKATIKKSMGILAVGAILVFASTTIIKLVVAAAQEAASITTK